MSKSRGTAHKKTNKQTLEALLSRLSLVSLMVLSSRIFWEPMINFPSHKTRTVEFRDILDFHLAVQGLLSDSRLQNPGIFCHPRVGLAPFLTAVMILLSSLPQPVNKQYKE
jgi:hypothetical protein